METTVTTLDEYHDDRGNRIVYAGKRKPNVHVRFRGRNNTLLVDPATNVRVLKVLFAADNGTVRLGPTTVKRSALHLALRLGNDSTIVVGSDVGTAGKVLISAVEGADVHVGDDVMFAQDIELRCDDSHPIYDVRSGKRTNPSATITLGDHVWVARRVIILGGVSVGSGSVIGVNSIVTRSVPNNCIAVGSPARVVRRDIAWERPVTYDRPPGSSRPRRGEKSDAYWNLTDGETPARVHSRAHSAPPAAAARSLRHRASRALHRGFARIGQLPVLASPKVHAPLASAAKAVVAAVRPGQRSRPVE